jgi:hypothetical protein
MAMISLDSLMGNQGPSYPEQIAAPYRKELVDAGFEQMMTVEDVEKVLAGNPGKTILVEQRMRLQRKSEPSRCIAQLF